MSIGTKLKAIREYNGHCQKEIADQLNISQPLYSQIENGNRNIKFDKLLQFCDIYGISLHEIKNHDSERIVEDLSKCREKILNMFEDLEVVESTFNGNHVQLKVNGFRGNISIIDFKYVGDYGIENINIKVDVDSRLFIIDFDVDKALLDFYWFIDDDGNRVE